MPNMSYARFRNTLADLRDCYNVMEDVEALSEEEMHARCEMLKLCDKITYEFELEIGDLKAQDMKQYQERLEARLTQKVRRANAKKTK